MEKKVIMIVDDEPAIRHMTEKFLKKAGYNTIASRNGQEALSYLRTKSPDLVLLDIEMPEMNGFEVCEEIRRFSNVPIIFLTVRRDTFDKVRSFKLGGDDFLTKPFSFEELEARISANLRRYYTYAEANEEILVFNHLEIHLHDFTCFLDGEKITLSTKEMELLILLASHPNQVWSQEQLYDHIWSRDATGNIDTVRVHISYLRRKLNNNRHSFIKTVHGFGYLFSTTDKS